MKTHFLKHYHKTIQQKEINFKLENALQQKIFNQAKPIRPVHNSWFTIGRWVLVAPAAVAVLVLGIYSYNLRPTKQVATNISFLQLVQTAYAQDLAEENSGKIHYQKYKAYLESNPSNNSVVDNWEIQQGAFIKQVSNVIDTSNALVHKTVSVTDTTTNTITVYSNSESATGEMKVSEDIEYCAKENNDPYLQIHSMIEGIKTETLTMVKQDILNKLVQATAVEDLGENNGKRGLRIQEPIEVPVDCNTSRAALFITEYYFDVQTLQLKKEISGLQGEAMSVMEYLEEEYLEPTADNLQLFDTTGLRLES